MIKETNEKFLNGEITWHDAVNAFDNLPLVFISHKTRIYIREIILLQDEFEAEKTGLIEPELRGKGLLRPSEEDRVDERSERYFERFFIHFPTLQAQKHGSWKEGSQDPLFCLHRICMKYFKVKKSYSSLMIILLRFNLSRADAPASYNSKDLGNVSPVKDQVSCLE